MIVKTHTQHKKLIIAVCDSDIIGKKFEQENLQLDLSSNFYNGEEMKESRLMFLTKHAYIINAVGKKSIDFFEKRGIISKENVITIDGVPSVQILIGIESLSKPSV